MLVTPVRLDQLTPRQRRVLGLHPSPPFPEDLMTQTAPDLVTEPSGTPRVAPADAPGMHPNALVLLAHCIPGAGSLPYAIAEAALQKLEQQGYVLVRAESAGGGS